MRSLIGATTREAVRAQLREEQLLAAMGSAPPPNGLVPPKPLEGCPTAPVAMYEDMT